MGVVKESSSVWEPNPSIYIFIMLCCLFSTTLLPHLLKRNRSSTPSVSPFDHSFSSSSSSLRYGRNFLFLYCLASVMEGMWSVFGELELAHYGLSKERMVTCLCLGYGAALLFSAFLGMLSDLIGHKKACLIFCALHLFVGIWKMIASRPSIWIASICLPLATSIFSFSFEAWVVVENEKQGHRQDALNDMFWLMTFVESAALIASQALSNWLVSNGLENGVASSSTATIVLAMIGFILVSKGWKGSPQTAAANEHRVSYAHILRDKRMWLLGLAHGSLQFSTAVFWILWAPTLVADGREVHLGLVYPCLQGARMLGSTVFPWLFSGPLSPRIEDGLAYAFIALGIILSVVAYDYQEIGLLVSLFCLFHAGIGLIIPSLARLRTMHVPNDLRGGMMGLSLIPANAAILFFLALRGYYQSIENSTMMAFAALGLFAAAGCMHLLKQWGKQPYQNWHKL